MAKYIPLWSRDGHTTCYNGPEQAHSVSTIYRRLLVLISLVGQPVTYFVGNAAEHKVQECSSGFQTVNTKHQNLQQTRAQMVELVRIGAATDTLWHYRASQFDLCDVHNPRNNW